MTQRALITGCGGQDGSFLCDLLLERGYEVHGIVRRSSLDNLARIAHCRDKIILHQGDVTDASCLEGIIADVSPHEVYHEADQDSVGWSHVTPAYQVEVTVKATVHLLEACRVQCREARIFLPCSAMMFGDPAFTDLTGMQDEQSPLNPQSPYGVAKCHVFYMGRMYRQRHDMFVANGILFNHDSERRSEHYLLHKICRGVKRIAAGQQHTLALGNLDGRVDVGYARDYMEAAIAMLQFKKPDDFVIATAQAHSVEDMVHFAFQRAGMKIGPRDLSNYITVDPQFYYQARGILRGNPEKAWNCLNWRATTHIKDLIGIIMDGERAEGGKAA